MKTSTEHILKCNQSELLADAGGRIVDLMNENDLLVDNMVSTSLTIVALSCEITRTG